MLKMNRVNTIIHRRFVQITTKSCVDMQDISCKENTYGKLSRFDTVYL